ncbi:MAG: ABC transporter permease [Lentisphaeria bacterium]|nr:ABC transporter permease [Lentisphaeria bacterium]
MAAENNNRISSFFRTAGVQIAEPVVFIGKVVSQFPSLFRKRGFRRKEMLYYLDLCGAKSIPVVTLICFLMGAVLGIQAALQMRKVGTEIFVVDLVGFSVLKEFGPLMVAMISTGRAASAFAAEIGTMKVNEEISALETMGIDPAAYLVYPKLLAMLISLPLLAVFGDAAGIAGGMLVGSSLNIPFQAYWARTIAVLDQMTFLLGVAKTLVFATLITLAGCYCGFRASSDAQGVGRGATSAVVLSIFLVVVADAVITLLYSFIGY